MTRCACAWCQTELEDDDVDYCDSHHLLRDREATA